MRDSLCSGAVIWRDTRHLHLSTGGQLHRTGELQRENCKPPTLLFTIMTLQEILFGTYTPPCTPSRVHRIGFAGSERYKPIVDQRKFKTPEGLNRAELAMYERLKKQVRCVSADHMGKKMKMTRNHAGMLLGSLFKMGKATRYKVSANGTRFYMYQAKD